MKDYLTTPKGTRDILLEERETQSWIEGQLESVFRSYGYHPVITPGIEYLDVYAAAPGNVGSEHMFKLIDNEGRILVLRPDSTAPIARLVASRLQGSAKPVRLYYNQRVYRQKDLYSGHRIETSQMGVELIGANSMRADMEMLQLAMDTLEGCGMTDYRIELGHGGLCELLLAQLAAEDSVKEQLRQWIQAKNYPALNDFLDTMGTGEDIRAIRALPGLFGGREVLDQAADIWNKPETSAIIDYTRSLFDALIALGMQDKLMLDLGFVNDNDYYTGIIFQAYIPGSGEAVLLGGRYDHLLARFGETLPAVGFGVNVDLLTKSRMDEGAQVQVQPSDALVWGEAGYGVQGMRYADTLRRTEGFVVENGLFEQLDQCVAYAQARGIKRIHVVGQHVKVIDI